MCDWMLDWIYWYECLDIARRMCMEQLVTKVFIHPEICIDFDKSEFIKEGISCALSRMELRLLSRLALEHGQVVSQEDIIMHLWGGFERSRHHDLQLIVHRLRKKLEAVISHFN